MAPGCSTTIRLFNLRARRGSWLLGGGHAQSNRRLSRCVDRLRRRRLVAILTSSPIVSPPRPFAPSPPGREPAQLAVLSRDEVPTFWLRARVLSAGGQPPAGRTFTFRFEVPSAVVSASGEAWSDWVQFGRSQIEAALARYPNSYLR